MPQGKVLGPVISKLRQKNFTCTCKKHIFFEIYSSVTSEGPRANSSIPAEENHAGTLLLLLFASDSGQVDPSSTTLISYWTSECCSGSCYSAVTPSCSRVKELHSQTGEADAYRNRSLLLGYSNLMVDSEHPIIKAEQ